jgi:hypothetical protein
MSVHVLPPSDVKNKLVLVPSCSTKAHPSMVVAKLSSMTPARGGVMLALAARVLPRLALVSLRDWLATLPVINVASATVAGALRISPGPVNTESGFHVRPPSSVANSTSDDGTAGPEKATGRKPRSLPSNTGALGKVG